MKYHPEIHKPTLIYPRRSRLRKLYHRQLCRLQLCHRQFCQRRFSHQQIYKLGMTIHLVVIGILSALICWWVLANTQLHLCLTPSLDGARILLFYKTPVYEIKRGDIVYIRGHEYKYLGPQPYAKRVVGLSGDPIIHTKDGIKIGERTLSLIAKTSEGQPLTPIAHDSVPQGYFFVAGDHPRSIDSRYEEFGLVPVRKIWGKEIFAW